MQAMQTAEHKLMTSAAKEVLAFTVSICKQCFFNCHCRSMVYIVWTSLIVFCDACTGTGHWTSCGITCSASRPDCWSQPLIGQPAKVLETRDCNAMQGRQGTHAGRQCLLLALQCQPAYTSLVRTGSKQLVVKLLHLLEVECQFWQG